MVPHVMCKKCTRSVSGREYNARLHDVNVERDYISGQSGILFCRYFRPSWCALPVAARKAANSSKIDRCLNCECYGTYLRIRTYITRHLEQLRRLSLTKQSCECIVGQFVVILANKTPKNDVSASHWRGYTRS